MSSFPGSPRTVPGAIVAVDPLSALSRVAVFQYNPDEVTRTLKPRTPPSGAGASDADRVWGAPTQTISMKAELDATDGLEEGDPLTGAAGVAASLGVLEMLLYPSVARVIANTALLAAGTIEVIPPRTPLAVLAWGPGLVVPVRLESLTVTEQAFDAATLMPTRAAVDLSLQVLTYDDLSPTDPAFALFLAHQVVKESLATAAGALGVARLAAEV
jgi:non-ribosomal peptide synthetase component F